MDTFKDEKSVAVRFVVLLGCADSCCQ